jgi:rubrerythrin
MQRRLWKRHLSDCLACPVCGHIEFGKAPEKCPFCGTKGEKFAQV